MRTPNTNAADLSACFNLTLSQNLNPDQLESMETAYAFMLAQIRAAIAGQRHARKQSDAVKLHAIEARHDYFRQCEILHRLTRRAGIKSIAKSTGHTQTVAREMTSTGRRIASEKKSAAKKRAIIRLAQQGIGPRPIARIIGQTWGRCSAAYVCKVVQAEQPRLIRDASPL